jgi:solute carrier family 29 (equilibrative nucleoside transporter) protein 4
MDPLDQVGDPSKGQYGVLKIQTSPLGTESAGGSVDLNGKQDINFTLNSSIK